MGTEISVDSPFAYAPLPIAIVKLNNPLMGTEILLYHHDQQRHDT